jgi:hypothetical protein
MSSCQLLPLTGQACELEMSFSLGETVSFSLLPVSPRPSFPHSGCWVAPYPQGLFQILILPLPPGRKEIFPLCFSTSFVQRECNWPSSSARIWDSLTWQVSKFAWLKMDQLQDNAGRQQTEVLCLLIFWWSQSSHMLAAALFLWFSGLQYFGEGVDTLRQRERELHTWAAIRGSVSALIMMGPGIPRCLQVSATLCILF